MEGLNAMKEREIETDRRVRALQMLLSEDKVRYLVVADAPVPGHAWILLTTVHSGFTQQTFLSD